MEKKKAIFLLLALLFMIIIVSPVLAESAISLSKGQILRVEPDGKVTVGQMDTGAKMQDEIKKGAQPVTKVLRVWFDQNGQLFYHTDADAIRKAVSGDAMDK